MTDTPRVCPICDEAPLQIDPVTQETYCPHCADFDYQGMADSPAPEVLENQ